MLLILVQYLCASFEKIYYGVRLLLSSQISGRMYNSVVSNKCMMWKVCRSPILCRYWDTIVYFKWVVLGLSQDEACTNLFENFSENSLKGDLSNDNIVTPSLFSLVNTFNEPCTIHYLQQQNVFCFKAFLAAVFEQDYFLRCFSFFREGPGKEVCVTFGSHSLVSIPLIKPIF